MTVETIIYKIVYWITEMRSLIGLIQSGLNFKVVFNSELPVQ